jgi:hypothetical protein
VKASFQHRCQLALKLVIEIGYWESMSNIQRLLCVSADIWHENFLWNSESWCIERLEPL